MAGRPPPPGYPGPPGPPQMGPPPQRPAAPPPPGPEPARPEPIVNVSQRYPAISMIKVMAILFLLITCALNIIISIQESAKFAVAQGPDGGRAAAGGLLAAIGLTVVGMVLGFMSILRVFRGAGIRNIIGLVVTVLSPMMIIFGAAARGPVISVGSMSTLELALSIVFAVFFLLYIEYLHASKRFTDIGEMAIRRNLKEFDFGHVVNHYIAFGFAMLILVLVIAMAVVGLQMLLTRSVFEQFGRSVEVNSVFGFAMAEAVFFGLLGIVLAVIFGGKEYVKSIKTAASYSRKKLDELASRAATSSQPGPAPAPGQGPPQAGPGQPQRR